MNNIATEQRFGGAILIATSKVSTPSQPLKKDDPLQQVEENLKYLEQQRQIAKVYANIPVAERRYGGALSLYEQQQQQREAGLRAIQDIEKSKLEQLKSKKDIEEYNRQRAEAEAKYEIERKAYEDQLEDNRTARAGQIREYNKSIVQSGFIPVYDDKGVLTGYEDPNTKMSVPLQTFSAYFQKTYPAPVPPTPKQIQEQKLYNDFQTALKTGSIGGFTIALSPQQQAKAELLAKVTSQPTPSFITYKGFTYEGQKVLTSLQKEGFKQLPLSQQLVYNIPPPYYQIQSLPSTPTNITEQYYTSKESIGNIIYKPLPKMIKQSIGLVYQYGLGPFKAIRNEIIETGQLIQKGGSKLSNNFYGIKSKDFIQDIGLTVEVTSELVPTTVEGFAGYYLFLKSYESFPKITSTLLSGLGIKDIIFGEDKKTKILGGIQFGLGILGLKEAGTFEKAEDIIKTRGREKIKLEEFSVKPFFRQGDVVFMRRFEGIKFDSTKGFIRSTKELIEGYKRGQFVEYQRRIISPEVRLKYFPEIKPVKAYFIEDGKIIQRVVEPKPFPYAPKEQQLLLFKKKGIQEYYIPKKSELPIDIKTTGFGIHTTSNIFPIPELNAELYQVFFSGKGASIRFGRLSGERKLPKEFGLNLKESQQPALIVSYFKDVISERPIKEIKIKNPFDKEGKPIKQYLFKNYGIKTPEDVLIVPEYKAEVEGVIRGRGIDIRQKYYFELGGRRVLIDERAYGYDIESIKKELSAKELKKFREIKQEGPKESILPELPREKSSLILYKNDYSYDSIIKEDKFISSLKLKEYYENYKAEYTNIYKISNKGDYNISIVPEKSYPISYKYYQERYYDIPISPKQRTPEITKEFKLFEPEKPIIFQREDKTKKQFKEDNQAYHIYVKEPKQKTFTKIPNKSLNKRDALNLGSYITDNSTARTYYIKPTKNKPQKLGLDIDDIYFEATRDKFRDYKIKMGKKISYKGYIEKNNYLIDSVGEINQLSAFKQLAKLKKNSGGASLQNYAMSL